MQLNIPKTSTVSHELPIFTQLSQDSKLPVSEIKARFRQEMLEQHRKAMDNPSIMPMNADSDTMFDMCVASLQQKLEHPEEVVDEDKEYQELFNLEPGEQDPSASQFSPIDNTDLGFSDDGMASLDQVADEFGSFGADDLTGDSINAISETEPGIADNPDGETESESVDELAVDDDALDDLDF